jgi:hypothetical protein
MGKSNLARRCVKRVRHEAACQLSLSPISRDGKAGRVGMKRLTPSPRRVSSSPAPNRTCEFPRIRLAWFQRGEKKRNLVVRAAKGRSQPPVPHQAMKPITAALIRTPVRRRAETMTGGPYSQIAGSASRLQATTPAY